MKHYVRIVAAVAALLALVLCVPVRLALERMEASAVTGVDADDQPHLAAVR